MKNLGLIRLTLRCWINCCYFFFLVSSAKPIEVRNDHISLCASGMFSSRRHAALITPKLHSDDILIQAVWYDPVSHTQEVRGTAPINSLVEKPFLYGSASPYLLSKAEYRLYAYRVNPETGMIIDKISPISDIMIIKLISAKQLTTKQSYAPFFLNQSRLTSYERKMLCGGSMIFALLAVSSAALFAKHYGNNSG